MANNFTLSRFKQVLPSLTEEQLKRAAQKLNIDAEGFDVGTMRNLINAALENLELPFSMEDITPKPARLKLPSWTIYLVLSLLGLMTLAVIFFWQPTVQAPKPDLTALPVPTQLVPTPQPPATAAPTSTVPPTARSPETPKNQKVVKGDSVKVIPDQGASCFKEVPPPSNSESYKSGKVLGKDDKAIVMETIGAWALLVSMQETYDDKAVPCWVQETLVTVLPKPTPKGTAITIEMYDPLSTNPFQLNRLRVYENGVYRLVLGGLGDKPEGLLIFVDKKLIRFIVSPRADDLFFESVFRCESNLETYSMSLILLGGTNSGANWTRQTRPCGS